MAAPLRQLCHTRDDGSTHVRFIDAPSPNAMRPPSSGPQKPSAEPLPKKPRLEEEKDAAIDDPRLQALRREHERELRELLKKPTKEKKRRRRKIEDDEQLSKEDAAIDDATQAPVGEHRLRKEARRLRKLRRRQKEAFQERLRRQEDAIRREGDELYRRKREALEALRAAAAAAASSPAAPADEADAPVAPPPPTPPSLDAARDDGADAAAAALAETLAAWASSPAAPSAGADALVAVAPPPPPSPDAPRDDGAAAAAAALAETLAAWASSPAAPVDEVDAPVAPPPPTPRPSLDPALADGAVAAAAALAATPDDAALAGPATLPATSLADGDEDSPMNLHAPAAAPEVPSPFDPPVAPLDDVEALPMDLGAPAADPEVPSPFDPPVAPAAAARGVLTRVSVLAAAAAGPSFLAEGATPRRRRASATRTSSAPRALGAFELDDDAEGDDDDDGGAPPPPPSPSEGSDASGYDSDATTQAGTDLQRERLDALDEDQSPPQQPDSDAEAEDPLREEPSTAPSNTLDGETYAPLKRSEYKPGDELTFNDGKDSTIKAVFIRKTSQNVARVEVIEDENGPVKKSDSRARQRYGRPLDGSVPVSRFRGVSWNQATKSWRAYYVDAKGRMRQVGMFFDEETAARARDEAVRAARLEGKRTMNVDESGSLVPKSVCGTRSRGRAAAVAPPSPRARPRRKVAKYAEKAIDEADGDEADDEGHEPVAPKIGAVIEVRWNNSVVPEADGFWRCEVICYGDGSLFVESDQEGFGDPMPFDPKEDSWRRPVLDEDEAFVDDDDEDMDEAYDEADAEQQESEANDGEDSRRRLEEVLDEEKDSVDDEEADNEPHEADGIFISIPLDKIDGYVSWRDAEAARGGETRKEYDARIAKEAAARKEGPPPPIPIHELPPKAAPKANLCSSPMRDEDDSDSDSESDTEANAVVQRIYRVVWEETKKEDPSCYFTGDDGEVVVTDREATAKLLGYESWDAVRVFFSHFEFKRVGGGGRGCPWIAYKHEHFCADGADLHLIKKNDEGWRCFTTGKLRCYCPCGKQNKGFVACGGGICPKSGKPRAYCKLGCEPSEEGKPPCGNAIPRQQLGRLLGEAFSKNHTSREIHKFFGFESQDLRNVLIAGSPYGPSTVQMWHDRLLEIDHIISLRYLREHLGVFVTKDGDKKEPTLWALMASCLLNLQLLLRYLNGLKSDKVTDETLKGIERRYKVLMRAVALTDPSGDGRWICPHPLKKQKKGEEKVYVNIDILCQLLKEDVAKNGGEIGCEKLPRYQIVDSAELKGG